MYVTYEVMNEVPKENECVLSVSSFLLFIHLFTLSVQA